MIYINLAPSEEIEDKHWFVPDLIVLGIFCALMYLAVSFYLESKRQEIESLKQEVVDLSSKINRLQADLGRFKELNKEIAYLSRTLVSIEQITVSKVARYRPIILLEHIQTLKPKGLWYSSFEDDSENNVVRISGGAMDNLIVAEFMVGLHSTQLQEVDIEDIRTQLVFTNMHLIKVAQQGSKGSSGGSSRNSPGVNSDVELKEDEALVRKGETSGGNGSRFPELVKFPRFDLNVRYVDRSIEIERKDALPGAKSTQEGNENANS